MGEPINGLRKMSISRHRYVEIKDGDLVYIVTTPSIAKEAGRSACGKHDLPSWQVAKLITQNCVYLAMPMRVTCSSYLVYNPSILFPIQGEYRGLDAHAKGNNESSFTRKYLIPKRGSVMSLRKWRLCASWSSVGW